MGVLPEELGKRILKRKLSPLLTQLIALRARKYDQLCLEFLEEFPERQAKEVVFIAEGLFMYLPGDPVINILIQLADSFKSSRLVMEVVTEKYTRGSRRKVVEKKMRKGAGSTAGDYYQYGIKNAGGLESYAAGFRVRGEWSFFEDTDLRPSFLQLFKHSRSLSKTRYTVIVDINPPGSKPAD